MKTYTLLIALLFSLAAMSQGVDSTQILQRVDSMKQKHVLHWMSVMDKNDPEVYNLTLELLPQYDSVGREYSDKPISFKGITSGQMASSLRKLSQLPEGQATQYNEEMLNVIFPKLTNPWLINQFGEIRAMNWAARDARIRAEATKIEQIIKLKQ